MESDSAGSSEATPPYAGERREVWYQGRVQGVGFRYTTRQAAENLPITGFVQNLSDGRVLVVAEGRADDLDRFFDLIDRELGRYISSADARNRPATGEFPGFSIRH